MSDNGIHNSVINLDDYRKVTKKHYPDILDRLVETLKSPHQIKEEDNNIHDQVLREAMNTLGESTDYPLVDNTLSINNLELPLESILEAKRNGEDVVDDILFVKKSMILLILEDFGNYSPEENQLLENAIYEIRDRSLDLLMHCRNIHVFGKGQIKSLPRMQELQRVFLRMRLQLDRFLDEKDFCDIVDDILKDY